MTQQARPKPSIPLTADAFADHQETAVYWSSLIYHTAQQLWPPIS